MGCRLDGKKKSILFPSFFNWLLSSSSSSSVGYLKSPNCDLSDQIPIIRTTQLLKIQKSNFFISKAQVVVACTAHIICYFGAFEFRALRYLKASVGLNKLACTMYHPTAFKGKSIHSCSKRPRSKMEAKSLHCQPDLSLFVVTMWWIVQELVQFV